ncbi:MAG: hypothetical protein Q7U91_08050 [Sideroxyarcus sp.]|nr:hypothetical protein [Sideroxyarcus sp.]
MVVIPMFVNAIVICVLTAELIATALGMVSPDQLLIASTLSGILTFLSFKLSQEALLHINGEVEVVPTPAPEKEDSAQA